MNHLSKYTTNYDPCKQRWEDLVCQQIEAANITDKEVYISLYVSHIGLLIRPLHYYKATADKK